MTPPGIVLLLAGASLEAIGLGVVALENVDVSRAFRRRDVAVFPAPARLRLRGFPARAMISDGGSPTIDQRLDALVSEIDGIERKLDELADEIPKQVREDLEPLIESVRNQLQYEIDQLRSLMSSSVQPTRRRWIGLAAFAAGLLLQVIANLVG